MAYWFVMFVDFNGDLRVDRAECDAMNCEWATPMCHAMVDMCDYDGDEAFTWCELGMCEWELSEHTGCVPMCDCFNPESMTTEPTADSHD